MSYATHSVRFALRSTCYGCETSTPRSAGAWRRKSTAGSTAHSPRLMPLLPPISARTAHCPSPWHPLPWNGSSRPRAPRSRRCSRGARSAVSSRRQRPVSRRWPMPQRLCGSSARCRSEEHTSELQSLRHLVCRLLLEKKNTTHHEDDQRTMMRHHFTPELLCMQYVSERRPGMCRVRLAARDAHASQQTTKHSALCLCH